MTTPNQPAPIANHALILIVDDDVALGDLFARGLRGAGYEVRVARSADEGLEATRMFGPNAIILDFRMPLINGLGFLYRLRAAEPDRRTLVVVVTGETFLTDDVRAEFDKLGAHVRYKPITPLGLVEVIRAELQNPRARSER